MCVAGILWRNDQVEHQAGIIFQRQELGKRLFQTNAVASRLWIPKLSVTFIVILVCLDVVVHWYLVLSTLTCPRNHKWCMWNSKMVIAYICLQFRIFCRTISCDICWLNAVWPSMRPFARTFGVIWKRLGRKSRLHQRNSDHWIPNRCGLSASTETRHVWASTMPHTTKSWECSCRCPYLDLGARESLAFYCLLWRLRRWSTYKTLSTQFCNTLSLALTIARNVELKAAEWFSRSFGEISYGFVFYSITRHGGKLCMFALDASAQHDQTVWTMWTTTGGLEPHEPQGSS